MASLSNAGGHLGGDGTPAETARSTSQNPTGGKLGKYELKRTIGAGGMGTVYLAVDTDLKRTVALKILSKEKAANATLVKRFRSEAQSAAQLKHDNIVTVYEAGQVEGHLYIALEYIEGVDVQHLVEQRGVIPVKQSVEIIRQVALALDHAHGRGIVHRDIKPSNLLIQRNGMVKLTDMGLARSIDDSTETGITRAGMTVGTVDYMSPEQARDSKMADVRSDIYSLGCTWYQMLTGTTPFSEGSLTNKLYAHVAKPRPDPRDINDSVPESVVYVVQRMMAKKPDDRYQTPTELLDELENVDSSPDIRPDAIVAALDDEIRTDDSERDQRPKSRPTVIPPRTPQAEEESDPEQPTRGLANLKYMAVWAAGIGFLVLLGWMALEYASVFDSPSGASSRNSSPFASDDPTSPQRDPGHVANRTSDSPTNTSHGSGSDQPSGTPSPKLRKPKGNSKNSPPPAGRTPSQQPMQIPKRLQTPKWVAEKSSPVRNSSLSIGKSRQRITVGRINNGPPSEFTDLVSALQHFSGLSKRSAVIELVGAGPFVLPPVVLIGFEHLEIVAAEGSRPLVVMTPGLMDTPDVLARISRSQSISLTGLDVVVPASHFPSSDPLTLVDSTSGTLSVRDCSVTLLGDRRGSTTAFRISGMGNWSNRSPSNQSRVLIENTYVRGANMTALEVDQTATDVLAKNCLFATGEAPVVKLTATSSGQSISESGSQPLRTLRLDSCSAIARESVFEFDAGADSGNPPTTAVYCKNSFFSAETQSSESTLLWLRNWPENPSGQSAGTQLRNLRWISESSLYVGWSNLIQIPSSASPVVRGHAAWARTWKTPAARSQFLSTAWPGTIIEDFASLSPSALDVSTVERQSVASVGEGPAGCDVSLLAVPDLPVLGRALALIERPQLPTPIAPTKKVEIDLAKSDLGRVISTSNWETGTEFIASGAGRKKSSPIRVRGKSLRIRFVQTPGNPLHLEPRETDATSKDEANGAFIFVKDGTIEIEDGSIRIPSSTRRKYASRFLYVKNGSFSLRNMSVNAPWIRSPQFEEVIEWSCDEQSGGSKSGDNKHKYFGMISDSFLGGAAPCLHAEISNCALILHNSILTSSKDLCDLDVVCNNLESVSAVDSTNCTFSAGGVIFRIRGSDRILQQSPSLRFFITRTLVAPTIDSTTDRPDAQTLLAYTGPGREQQLDWIGQANGYATGVALFPRTDKNAKPPSPVQFEKTWNNAWQTGRVTRMLTEAASALFQRLPRDRNKVDFQSFRLRRTSKAARWAADGSAIGADLSALQKAQAESNPKAEFKPDRPRKSTKPNRPRKKTAKPKKGVKKPDF